VYHFNLYINNINKLLQLGLTRYSNGFIMYH